MHGSRALVLAVMGCHVGVAGADVLVAGGAGSRCRTPSGTSWAAPTWALFTSPPNPKYFIFYPSHQIFRRMHGALN
jgi:hypothetical protein